MKRFKFQLESLLRVKKQFHRVAELKQIRQQGMLQQARRRLEELHGQLQQTSDHLLQYLGEPVPAGLYQSDQSCSTQIRDRIGDAQTAVDRAEEEYQRARDECRGLAVAVEALEQLRGEKWDEYLKQNTRETLESLDDLILRGQLEAQRSSQEVAPHA